MFVSNWATCCFTPTNNEMIKKWVDFVKIKFHLNENIEWICIMQPELNWRPHIDVLLLWTSWDAHGFHHGC
jgi:hypothetical protein